MSQPAQREPPEVHIAIVYNDPGAGAPDQDVLVQRDSVTEVLTAAGHVCTPVACTLDLESLRRALTAINADCVFNLVESLGGTDRLSTLVPLLLDSMQIPYTGSRALTMLQTADKLVVKRKLHSLGLPTPQWADDETAFLAMHGHFIIKPRFEHASMGIDDNAVVHVTSTHTLKSLVRERAMKTGISMFAERFIEGREFNIAAMTDVTGRTQILSPAEIDFSRFPEAKPKIVGYNAKWAEDTFEYNATPRIFHFSATDNSLLEELKQLVRSVWDLFELQGYARVDFRVDTMGNPFILEINTNPCLSPDAGFAAALTNSDLTFESGIERIIASAMEGHKR